MTDIYNQDCNIFQSYIDYSDEKTQIIAFILKTLSELQKSEITITDIGAGDGTIAIGILGKSPKQIQSYHYIEPSGILLEDFRSKNNFSNVDFHKGFFNQISLPKSDVIICSYVFQCFGDKKQALTNIHSALQPGGIGIIINPSYPDYMMELFGLSQSIYHQTSHEIIELLADLRIDAISMTGSSRFSGVQNIIKQDAIGKNLLSFLLNGKNPDQISESSREKILSIIQEHTTENNILPQEIHYIVFRK